MWTAGRGRGPAAPRRRRRPAAAGQARQARLGELDQRDRGRGQRRVGAADEGEDVVDRLGEGHRAEALRDVAALEAPLGRHRVAEAAGHQLQRAGHLLDLDLGLDAHALALGPLGQLAARRVERAVAGGRQDQRQAGQPLHASSAGAGDPAAWTRTAAPRASRAARRGRRRRSAARPGRPPGGRRAPSRRPPTSSRPRSAAARRGSARGSPAPGRPAGSAAPCRRRRRRPCPPRCRARRPPPRGPRRRRAPTPRRAGRTVLPASVSASPRPARANSGTPSSSSRRRTCSETEGCATRNAAAAAENEPCSAAGEEVPELLQRQGIAFTSRRNSRLTNHGDPSVSSSTHRGSFDMNRV